MSEYQPLVFKQGSHSRVLLDQIADKWSVMILSVLCEHPQRFNEVKRRLEGITQKALTEALRRLERNGLVARRVLPISPIAVEYSVTPLGGTLKGPFNALNQWSVDYLGAVEQAQRDYDLRMAQQQEEDSARKIVHIGR